MPATISSPIIPIGPFIFLSKIFAGNNLDISKNLKVKKESKINKRFPLQIINGNNWPINSSIQFL